MVEIMKKWKARGQQILSTYSQQATCSTGYMEKHLGDFQNVHAHIHTSLSFLTKSTAGKSNQIFLKAVYSLSFLWQVCLFLWKTSPIITTRRQNRSILISTSSPPDFLATFMSFHHGRDKWLWQIILHSDPLIALSFYSQKSRFRGT